MFIRFFCWTIRISSRVVWERLDVEEGVFGVFDCCRVFIRPLQWNPGTRWSRGTLFSASFPPPLTPLTSLTDCDRSAALQRSTRTQLEGKKWEIKRATTPLQQRLKPTRKRREEYFVKNSWNTVVPRDLRLVLRLQSRLVPGFIGFFFCIVDRVLIGFNGCYRIF